MPRESPVWLRELDSSQKKVIKEPMTSDPSSNLMNYVKFTVVIAASLATKDYLEKQKILPS